MSDEVRRILFVTAASMVGLEEHYRYKGDNELQRLLQEILAELGWFATTVKAPPGIEKSRFATELVTEAWKCKGKKGLYLMLSHSAIEERLKYPEASGWTHWQGHDDGKDEKGEQVRPPCPKSSAGTRGYSYAKAKCKCGKGKESYRALSPTIAPIDYILPTPTSRGEPLIRATKDFDFWVIDEMDFGRLVNHTTASLGDVIRLAESHPDGSIKALCSAFGAVMERVTGRLSSADLYKALGDELRRQGSDLGVMASLMRVTKPRTDPWLRGEPSDLPINFPPVLLPVFVYEAERWLARKPFNPRIHVGRRDGEKELRILRRKDYSGDIGSNSGRNHRPPSGYLPPPMIILDATADAELLAKVFLFGEEDVQEVDPPPWPDNVHVYQWSDDVVYRGTLGVTEGKGTFADSSLKRRQLWYGRIAEQLDKHCRDWPIGIITHKAIREEAEQAVRSMGFGEVYSLYYGNERGSNIMEKVRVLVLLGLPIPNIDGFKEEAQAYLDDADRPLDFTWGEQELSLNMRDGSMHPVRVGGYWNEPVYSYYRQKCQYGLYQALHRIRPYIPKDDDRYIYIFTNMPVPDVLVEGVIQTQQGQRIDDMGERAVEAIQDALAERSEATVPEIAQVITLEGENQRSNERWIADGGNGERLARAAGAVFERGRGRRPGRFMRA